MRDVHTVLKNWSDSPFHPIFQTLQENMQKLINSVKIMKLNENRKDQDEKNLLESTTEILFTVFNMWNKFEDIKEQQEKENLNEAIQIAANTTSQILRCVYSGSYDSIENLCELFIERCTFVTDLALANINLTNSENKLKLKQLVQLIETLAEEIVGRAKQITSVNDQTIEEEKNNITFTTKKLVQAFRGLTSVNSSVTANSIDPKPILLSSYKTLNDSVEAYKDLTNYNAGQLNVLDKSKSLLRLLLKLLDLQASKEEPVILHDIIILTLQIEEMISQSMDASILQKISELISAKKNVPIDIGFQIRENSAHIRYYCTHINLRASSIALGVQLPSYRYLTSEAVFSIVSILKTMMKIFMEYNQFLLKENPENSPLSLSI